MTFIVPDNDLEQKLNKLKRFNTLQEKNALLVEDEKPIYDVVSELTDQIPENELEANMFLLKLREISVSDTIDMIITCPHCGALNDNSISLENFININSPKIFKDSSGKSIKLPIGCFNSVEDIINNKEAERLTLKEYNEIEKLLIEQNNDFLGEAVVSCRICKKDMKVEINPRINFSKSSLSSIFQEYVDISIFSNNGKLDIDSLYPFEREIFVSLIKDKINSED